ncbi:MAG: 6-chlorohydroxyquinol-1,2-dioxygenase [Hyphomicrobiales bacterium]|nr:6-chlorohydroxyquinol-1,2-dioxygenase [Hyphomicrobiales bacterium]MDE2114421.1 6-chlorohydroxyquinol-1,2-dioxygenase [Hyphomicrobiales bacterium]
MINPATGTFSEASSAEVVNARHTTCANQRLAEVVSSLVRHLHDFAKEIHLSQGEWDLAIDFLTKTGQKCTTERQEFILLSDVLGFSMLVDAINNRRPEAATENTVFGPFHVDNAPKRQMGESICLDGKGETCLFEGQILDLAGQPIANATVDVWSDNADGYYDVQQPGIQPPGNNRGVFVTGAEGRYAFRGIKPVSYPIPDDGPVGQMLRHLGRHPYRPAHMHYLITAEGFQRLVTHTFVGGDEYLASDAVFGVKASLIAPFERLEGRDTLWRSPFNFILTPA